LQCRRCSRGSTGLEALCTRSAGLPQHKPCDAAHPCCRRDPLRQCGTSLSPSAFPSASLYLSESLPPSLSIPLSQSLSLSISISLSLLTAVRRGSAGSLGCIRAPPAPSAAATSPPLLPPTPRRAPPPPTATARAHRRSGPRKSRPGRGHACASRPDRRPGRRRGPGRAAAPPGCQRRTLRGPGLTQAVTQAAG
jgi:hypothetical protein